MRSFKLSFIGSEQLSLLLLLLISTAAAAPTAVKEQDTQVQQKFREAQEPVVRHRTQDTKGIENALEGYHPAEGKCLSSEFECDNGYCIPDYWQCDGYFDCPDLTDELYCYNVTMTTIITTDELLSSPSTSSTTSPSRDCPIPYHLVGDRCIFVDPFVQGSWSMMRYRCIEFVGHLLEVNNANFLYDVIQYLEENGLMSYDYWLGGCKSVGTNSTYKWQESGDIVKMGTPLWAIYYQSSEVYYQEPKNEQDEQCIYLNKNRKLYFSSGSPTTVIASTICQRERNKLQIYDKE